MLSPVSASYWGISGYVILYVLFAVALVLFGLHIYKLYTYVRVGKDEDRFDHLTRRAANAFSWIIFQVCNFRTVSRKDLAGIGHAMIFFGFVYFAISYLFLFIGAAWTDDFSVIIFGSTGAKVFGLLLEIFAALVIIGIVWATVRRYLNRPVRLEPTTEAGFILMLIFLLMVTQLFMDGLRVAENGGDLAGLLPVGGAISGLFAGMGESAVQNVYVGVWWAHHVLLFSFLIYIPYSKHLHIVTSPFNVLFRSYRPRGALTPIDFEKAQTLGAGKLREFTWKQLLDGYACAQCGRCKANCPANTSGKSLSPKDMILNIKEHLLEEGKTLVKLPKPAAPAADVPADAQPPEAAPGSNTIIGKVITEEELWQCTTCRACQEQCPVANEHLDKIIDMRRYLALEHGSIPEKAGYALRSIEDRGYPWWGATVYRDDWAEKLDVKNVAQDSDIDILYWVGCTPGLEDRSAKTAQAFTRLLKQAGIRFGILGRKESCCGDPARRLGDEDLFQIQARKNIELLNKYHVRKIVTTCPHCFNTIKNEYPQFGGMFEVIHHTQLIADLLRENKVSIAGGREKILTYQDPCYLGRYNDIYEPPRQIIESLKNETLVEVEQNREQSFCCGGGGGHAWLEERGKRIGELRIEQLAKTGAQTVITACPFCLLMLEDGARAKADGKTLQVLDIAELLDESLQI